MGGRRKRTLSCCPIQIEAMSIHKCILYSPGVEHVGRVGVHCLRGVGTGAFNLDFLELGTWLKFKSQGLKIIINTRFWGTMNPSNASQLSIW